MARRILVVDDDVDIRTELTEFLETKGYQVEVAGDGREALDMIKAVPADVVITDIKMPRGDGYELIRQLRAMDPVIPIIIIAGHVSQADFNKAKNLGGTIIMKKPISVRKLYQHLKHLNESEDE